MLAALALTVWTAAETAVVMVVTAGSAAVTHLLSRRRRPMLSAVVGGLVVPLALIGLAVCFLILPNPNHRDGSGMGMAASLYLAMLSAPISAITGVMTFLILRQSKRPGA
jgi:hypothetical protein